MPKIAGGNQTAVTYNARVGPLPVAAPHRGSPMLTFRDRPNRREFLSVGSLALGGLTLPSLLAGRAAASAIRPVTDKSVIFLFMHGGPPQQEMFDPKMTAPIGVRSTTGETKTSIPGVTFGGTLTRLAKLAHKFSIVRSFKTGDGNHDIKPIVGRDTLNANMGSLYARVAGPNHPQTGMPSNIALFPRAVNANAQPAVTQFGKFDSTGMLGAAYAPFAPGNAAIEKGAGDIAQKNMSLTLPRERLTDRRGLLAQLDRMKRTLDETRELDGADRFQSQAFDTILGGVADAFDLSKEDPRVVAAYDTAALLPAERIDKVWNNHKNYADNAATLGKLLLMARRLCERGAGFVTVTTNFVWDFHADVNNVPCELGMEYVGNPFDHAVSAFIEDLEARGLRDKILLVCCGEMGRTPKVNAKGGRDHWGGLAPLLLYGGGLKMGQVIGQSTKDGGEPDTEPITIANLTATIMHTLFDVGALRLVQSVPTDLLKMMTQTEPIRELMS